MTIQTPDEMLEEWRQKKGVTYRPDGTDSASEFWLSKMKAREQYLVGEIGGRKTIQELIDSGNMKEQYRVHPCDIAYKDGWNLNNDRILKLINPQESKK